MSEQGGGQTGGDPRDEEEKPEPQTPAPVTTTTATTATAPEPSTISTQLTANAVKLLAWLGTGAGFVTFVALTGTAITWARFTAAELPADQAVLLLPRQDNIVVGGIALALFAVFGLVAVTAAYAIDPPGRATDGMRAGLCVIVTLEVIVAIVLATDEGDDARTKAGVVAFILGGAGACLAKLAQDPGRWGPFKGLGERIATERKPIPPSLAQLKEHAERKKLDPNAPAPQPTYRSGLHPLALGLAGGVTIACWFYYRSLFDHPTIPTALLVASGLAVICFGVANASGERFWPYGAAVFFSVTVFGAVLMVQRLYVDTRVNPVALIRQGNTGLQGVVGLLVARTDDRYWLGAVARKCVAPPKDKPWAQDKDNTVPDPDDSGPAEGSGRIFSIPRNQVLDDEIGAPTTVADAVETAPRMLAELKRRQPPGGSPPAAGTTQQTTTVGTATTALTPAQQKLLSAPIGTPAPVDPVIVDAEAEAVSTPCNCVPKITKVQPVIAEPGKTVVIHGTGLGNGGRVTLNGMPLKTGEWTNESISVELPADATSGTLVVDCGKASAGFPIEVGRNAQPIASISAAPNKPGGRLFRLDGSGSRDPDGVIAKWRWSVGRETLSRRSTARFRMPKRGASVRLTVVDDRGARAYDTTELQVNVLKKTALATRTFDFGSAALTKGGKEELTEFRKKLVPLADSIVSVRFSGYADFVASDAFNLDLSRRRAEAVRAIVMAGLDVPKDKVMVKGYGESEAKAKTLGDPQREKDRRVDIEVRITRVDTSAGG